MTEEEVRKLVGRIMRDIIDCLRSEPSRRWDDATYEIACDMASGIDVGKPQPRPIVSFVWLAHREPKVGEFLRLPGDNAGFYRLEDGDRLTKGSHDVYVRVERQAAVG